MRITVVWPCNSAEDFVGKNKWCLGLKIDRRFIEVWIECRIRSSMFVEFGGEGEG
jgi:hypothetical protein